MGKAYHTKVAATFSLLFALFSILLLTVSAVIYSRESATLLDVIKAQERIVVTTGNKLIADIIRPVFADLTYLAEVYPHIAEDWKDSPKQADSIVLPFSASRPHYDQVRYIDLEGNEKIRINYSVHGPVAVEESQLQNKRDRYYFKDTISSGEDDAVYISPLDLNIEQGKIEIPYKPMIRFAKKIFVEPNHPAGIVVINYTAKHLIEKLHFWAKEQFGELMLLNKDGYWLHGRTREEEWGFMLPGREELSFRNLEPELWEKTIASQSSGQVQNENGLYTFTTIRPLQDTHYSSSGSATAFGKSEKTYGAEEYYWKMVSFVSDETLQRGLEQLRRRVYIFFSVALLLLSALSFFLARAQVKKSKYEHDLKMSNKLLETTVADRTAELVEKNRLSSLEIARRKETEAALKLSEERYRSIMQTMDDAVYITSPEYRIAYCNPSLIKLLGGDPTGQLCHRAIYDRAEKCPWCIVEELQRHSPITYEVEWEKYKKTYHVANSLIDFDGERNGKLTIFRDITGYIQAQEELQESERKYEQLLERMHEGFLVVDTKGHITFANTSFCAMLQRELEEVIHKPVAEFLDEENIRQFEIQFAKRQEHLAHPYDIEWVRKDGEKIITLVSPSILYDQEGEYIGSLGLISDITREKAAEEEKHRLERQLLQAQKMEALGTLAGGIAHDFNNILSAILGFGELAKQQAKQLSDTELEETINEVLIAGKRATQLVRQILAFARHSTTSLQVVALEPIVEEVIRLIRSALPATISVRYMCKSGNLLVLADPGHIHQVIMNLCTNAKQALGGEGGEVYIQLEKRMPSGKHSQEFVAEQKEYVMLEVADTGCGIPEDLQDRIFDPFFTTKEVGSGTGLGLSVVHSIVKEMNGIIEIESAEGEGTAVRVYFPVATEEQTRAPIVDDTLLYGRGERVAWVDDEAPLVALGCQQLESLRYSSAGYTQASNFIEYLTENPSAFACVIVDYAMPRLTGLELLRQIKMINPSLPVILCSGFSEEINEANAGEKGFHAFLLKPASKRDIALEVYTAVNKNRGGGGAAGGRGQSGGDPS